MLELVIPCESWWCRNMETLSTLLALHCQGNHWSLANSIHNCNGLCMDRTQGRSLQRPIPKPLGHKDTWMTQSLTLGWFVTLLPPFWNPSLLARATLNQGGSFHSQANPGYRCHQCNGPCRDRTLGRSLQIPTPKPLGHKGIWTTQSLTLGWFITTIKGQ